jgi:mycothiol synthase
LAQAAAPGHLNLKLAVELCGSGAAVAYGALQHTAFNFHPQKISISAVVDPTFQRQGIGTELYSRLEREAVARGAVCLWSSVLESDPRGIRFFERNGFSPLRRSWFSRLDLAKIDPQGFTDRSESLTRRGIRFTTLSAEGRDRPEVRDRLFRLSLLVSEDVPRLGDYTPVSFEQFAGYDLEGPGVLPEAYFLACEGAEYVGMSSLERELARPDTLRVGFTGTDPQCRGRGIASELKRRAVEYARDHAYRFLETYNDSLNRSIWAINEKLGFRQETTWVHGEKSMIASKPDRDPNEPRPGPPA